MKNPVKALVLFGFTLMLSVNGLFAQVFIFSLDETGKPNTANPLPSQVAPDPSGGVSGNVLIYTLPFFVQPGDLALFEPNQAASLPSDMIRFFNTPGATSIAIFYSDIEAGEPPNPADSGVPVSPNAFPVPEVGPEGNNGVVWTPLPGQPGAGPTGAQITYQIISDAPEPGAVAMMLAGMAALLAVNRLRRKGLQA